MMVTMLLAAARLGQEAAQTTAPDTRPLPDALTASPDIEIVKALLTVVITLVALRAARGWSNHAMLRERVEPGTRILVTRSLSVGIVVLGTLTALGFLGVSPATIVTLLGAVGLAFSLAVQDILKNFFAGVYLLLERPFRVGDRIRVKDQEGVVEHVGVRTTTLRTRENVEVMVPNAIVFAEVVSNHTHARPVEEPKPTQDAGLSGAAESPGAGAAASRASGSA